jgi:rod shape-determining protein MreD
VRGLISFVLVAVTVVFQLTVVDRIAFPGGSAPDLVLVEVAALSLASGPLAGALTGFWGGLALDVAPPGSHFTGEDALVFCLVGYACGLLADTSSGDGGTEGGHTALFEILVTAAGAMCGEALLALLGVMLSDPRVTWSAITNVLPVAVVYDVLLCPFVLYATAAALRRAGARGTSQARGVPGGFRVNPSGLALPGASQGAVRRAGGGSVPRLRLSEAGRGHGSMGGSRAGASRGLAPVRAPRLHLGRASSLPGLRDSRGSGVGLGAAFSTGFRDGHGGSSRVRFGSRRREGVLGGSLLGGARSSALRISGFSSFSTGRSLLGGSVFSRSTSSLSTPRSSMSRRSSASIRSSAFGRSSAFRRRGHMMRAPGGRPGSAPRLASLSRGRGRGRGLGRIFAAGRRPAQPRSPGQGWLRHTSGRRTSLGRGWTGASTGLRSGSRGLKGSRGPARLRMPRPKARRRWRKGGYR